MLDNSEKHNMSTTETLNRYLIIVSKLFILMSLFFSQLVYSEEALKIRRLHKTQSVKKCELTNNLKMSLILSSPYPVDNVTMQNCLYQWHISNKRFLKSPPEKRLRKIASVEVAPTKKNTPKNIQEFSLSLYSGVASISATDTLSQATEKAVSDVGHGIGVHWSHLWTEKLSFFAFGKFKKVEFKTSKDRTLENPSLTQNEIGTGLKVKVLDRFSLTTEIGMRESIFLNSDGGTELSIFKLSLPTVSLSTGMKLVQFASGFSLDLKLNAGTLLASKQKGYQTKQGIFYSAEIGSGYDLHEKTLFIRTGMAIRDIEIGNATQKSKDLGLTVGIGWNF